MSDNSTFTRLRRGIFEENPIFVQAIALCPVLAVTTSAINGAGMGIATLVVLASSCMAVSFVRKLIPAQVRIPCFIVISATFTTVVQLLLAAYLPGLNDALGIFIPLIVVNCIILARMEAFALKNAPLAGMFDAVGMGLGFTAALVMIGMIRELLGNGTFFGLRALPEAFPVASIMVLPPGGFFVLGFIIAGLTALKAGLSDRKRRAKDKPKGKPA